MTDSKRFYWLKLTEDFFREKEIKQLRRMAGGDTFTIIYLKMLLCSLKNDGKLYYEGIDSDFVSEVALDIDEDAENVKMTVAYLMSKGILFQGSKDEYELLTAKEMTGSEGESARRMRKLRSRNLLASHSDGDVTKSDTEIEIDIEIDKDKELEREKKKRKRFTAPTVDEVEAYAKEKGYTNFSAQRFVDYYESKGWVVGKSPMKDWKAAVRGWVARDGDMPQGRSKDWHNPALDYAQRDYSGTQQKSERVYMTFDDEE